MTPYLLTRPKVGFSPVTPQYDAGMRIEPPVSLPMAMKTMPEATAAADPPLDPPGMHATSHGLRTVPRCGLFDVIPYASSCMPHLPTITAPAACSFSTT